MGCDNEEVNDGNLCKPVRQRQSVVDLKFPLRDTRFRNPKRNIVVLSGDKCCQRSVEFSGLSPDIDRNTINEIIGPISTRTNTTITILDHQHTPGEINKLSLHFNGYTRLLIHVAICEVEQALKVRPRHISDPPTFVTKKAKVDALEENAVGVSESVEARKDISPYESSICPIIQKAGNLKIEAQH
ncbi:hypothetical protein ACHQM5_000076 [Ranunculus cassubicifolius]